MQPRSRTRRRSASLVVALAALGLPVLAASSCGGRSESPHEVAGADANAGACRGLGRYEAGKEGSYEPCCAGLNEIEALKASYGASGEVIACQSAPLRTYACVLGTCGDGVCEAPEQDCGCIRDCGGPSECDGRMMEPDRLPPPPLERRTTAPSCERERPCNEIVQGVGDACAQHAECIEGRNGRCQSFGYECTYDECFEDAECAADQLCDCSAGLNGSHRCISAECRTDADCPGGLACSPSAATQCANLSGTIGYHCHTPEDDCERDSDCLPDASHCVFEPAARRWVCSASDCYTR